MSVWFVSPHLDDAVLSCGEMIARTANAYVVTVFAGAPRGDHREIVEARRVEDKLACEVLGADATWMDYVDEPLRDPLHPMEPGAVEIILRNMTTTIGTPEFVFLPLGILHPDHVLTSDETLAWCKRNKYGCALYEEIPYRVEHPDVAYARLAELDVVGRGGHVDVPARGRLDLKRQAVECYASQVVNLDRDNLFVWERYWRLPRYRKP